MRRWTARRQNDDPRSTTNGTTRADDGGAIDVLTTSPAILTKSNRPPFLSRVSDYDDIALTVTKITINIISVSLKGHSLVEIRFYHVIFKVILGHRWAPIHEKSIIGEKMEEV